MKNAAICNPVGTSRGQPLVEILLAVYNGERYLDEFMQSIVAQDYDCWRILARDDGSSDSSPSILKCWEDKLRGKLYVLRDSGTENLGIAGNFTRLLQASSSKYVMLADYDDIWNPDKITITMEAMTGAEFRHGCDSPILVHTDFAIVDESLNLIAPFGWRHLSVVPKKVAGNFGHQIVQTCLWGPTTMLNRELIALAGDIPPGVLQDGWMSMVASTFGNIISVERPTVRYRRHGNNTTNPGGSAWREAIRALLSLPKMHAHLHDLLQLEHPRNAAFLARFRYALSDEQASAIEAFLHLSQLGHFRRRWSLVRYDLWFSSRIRSIGMFVIV